MTVKEFWISKQHTFPAADVCLLCCVRSRAQIQQRQSNNNLCSPIWQRHSGDVALSGGDCDRKKTKTRSAVIPQYFTGHIWTQGDVTIRYFQPRSRVLPENSPRT